jgi:hypothetical protein
MTTTLRRCCATCVHFRRGENAVTGWCAHPARWPETDVEIYVRERELACRMGWALDLWEQRGEDDAGEVVRVVGLKVWGPFHGATALDELPGDLLGLLVKEAMDGEMNDPGRHLGLNSLWGEDGDTRTVDGRKTDE